MKTVLEIDYDEEAIGVEELINNLKDLLAVNEVKELKNYGESKTND